jgi:L-lactate dehydrogenase
MEVHSENTLTRVNVIIALRDSSTPPQNDNKQRSRSSLINNYHGLSDVCFSLPTVVDRGGVEQVIHLELDKDEVEKLRHSAELLKTTIKSLGLN